MSRRLPIAVAAAALLLASHPADAQIRGGARSRSLLPSPAVLAPAGLERQWWGQADVNFGPDKIEFIYADEQNVYVTSKIGLTTAFDAETGRRLWSILLGNERENALPPVSNDRQVLAIIGMRMVAVDKFTGAEQWQLRVDSKPVVSPGIDEDRVYIGSIDGRLYAYNLRKIRSLFNDGKLPEFSFNAREWSVQAAGPISSSPSSDGRVVNFSGRDGTVYSVFAGNRKLRFQFSTSGQILTQIARDNDAVYVASTDLNVYKLNASDGRLQWTYLAGSRVNKTPRVIGNRLYVTPQSDGLTAIDTWDGLARWSQPAALDFVAASPGAVFASGEGNTLLALDPETGAIRSSLPMNRFSVWTGNERTDRIFLATPNGLVVCLRETGRDFPLYHRFPERKPLLPEFAVDAPAGGDKMMKADR